MARGLKAPVQLRLDVLPNGVAIGPVNEKALHGGVVNQLRLLAHIRVPLGKIHVPAGNRVYLSFILCHRLKSFAFFIKSLVSVCFH